jgi:hypothetical protein
MQALRVFLHALIFPKMYIAFLLITNAPNEASDNKGMPPNTYYTGVAVLVLGLLVLFYGSFITGRYKWLALSTRKAIAIAFIATLVMVDSAIIYYLVSISPKQMEYLT